MNYSREIPRDLFNEGRLLTELGHLSIAILNNKDWIADVLSMELENETSGFNIKQDENSGNIRVSNLSLKILSNLDHVDLYTNCNCKDKNALVFEYGEHSGDVFNGSEYSERFADFLESFNCSKQGDLNLVTGFKDAPYGSNKAIYATKIDGEFKPNSIAEIRSYAPPSMLPSGMEFVASCDAVSLHMDELTHLNLEGNTYGNKLAEGWFVSMLEYLQDEQIAAGEE